MKQHLKVEEELKPILRADFQQRADIPNRLMCPTWGEAEQVVSLRAIAKVESVADMPKQYLVQITNAISLAGDSDRFPYRDCKIDLVRMDTQHVRIGQRFVQNDKCLDLIGGFSRIFWDFASCRGFAGLTAKIVLGRDAADRPVIAHYLPSIIEEIDGELVALDGIHREFITRGVGASLETLVFRKVTTPFPCSFHHWREITQVNAKPPVAERYFDLQPDLFRDLKAIGIDG